VTKILNRFENRIKIDGAVLDLIPTLKSMRVSDLIAKAEGLKKMPIAKSESFG
jgi:hypothetical protein